MLETLEIKDFALIEHLQVDWTHGLNILTGETGAGKSIIIDALNALLGGKAGSSLIRQGAERAQIEGTFKLNGFISAWLKQNELCEEGDNEHVIVSREINRTGSRSRVNGTLVNQALMQDFATILITIHAQHEARTLMSSQAQLEMLDSLGDQKHRKLVEKVRTLASKRKDLAAQMRELQISEDERLRKLDFAKFQLNELEEAELTKADEDEELAHQQRILANVVTLSESVSRAYDCLSGGGGSGGKSSSDSSSEGSSSARDMIQMSLSDVERAARLDEDLNETVELIRQSAASLEEAAMNLRRYQSSLDTDPEVLSEIESRLAQLASLKRKYGPTLQDALTMRESLRGELDTLENAQAAIDGLSKELAEVVAELETTASELSSKRQKLAAHLSTNIQSELAELGMERCQFVIKFDALPDVGAVGIDKVDFLISPNPGQPLMPLAKIASGGELSRIMLAVKTIFASADHVATVIFDEIDTGLSGRVLQSMRDKLAKLAKSHQILCITHQPIIASVADNHVEVKKHQHDSHTSVSAETLGEDRRLNALAAMASGQENEEVALNFARSLVDQANQIRCQ